MTNQILIHNAHECPSGSWQPGWLLTDDRQIYALGPGLAPDFEAGRITRRIDAGGCRLCRLIDLHVHGAMDNESMDASTGRLAPHGVRLCVPWRNRFLATTWPSGERNSWLPSNIAAGLWGYSGGVAPAWRTPNPLSQPG